MITLLPKAAARAADAPGTDYSGTNTHEAGVDEPDVVKTDGRRIVTITQGVLQVVDPATKEVTGTLDLAANDQDHMRRFLQNLKTWGLNPRVVVTDGSNLYPRVLAKLWPDAEHQLCVFHVLKDINKLVLDAVRRVRTAMTRLACTTVSQLQDRVLRDPAAFADVLDVLTVPVAALVALAEGGYGLQVVDGATSRFVAVETGLFASGRVEVSGAGVAEGATVGMPS